MNGPTTKSGEIQPLRMSHTSGCTIYNRSSPLNNNSKNSHSRMDWPSIDFNSPISLQPGNASNDTLYHSTTSLKSNRSSANISVAEESDKDTLTPLVPPKNRLRHVSRGSIIDPLEKLENQLEWEDQFDSLHTHKAHISYPDPLTEYNLAHYHPHIDHGQDKIVPASHSNQKHCESQIKKSSSKMPPPQEAPEPSHSKLLPPLDYELKEPMVTEVVQTPKYTQKPLSQSLPNSPFRRSASSSPRCHRRSLSLTEAEIISDLPTVQFVSQPFKLMAYIGNNAAENQVPLILQPLYKNEHTNASVFGTMYSKLRKALHLRRQSHDFSDIKRTASAGSKQWEKDLHWACVPTDKEMKRNSFSSVSDILPRRVVSMC